MKISRESLVQQLEMIGYRFHKVSVFTEGNYTVKDAMWNYQDAVMHIPHVHRLVDNFPILVGDDIAASFFLQRAIGLRFPLVVLDLLSAENVQTAFTSCLFFVLIIENRCDSMGTLRTRVTTTYYIGAPRFFRWLSPMVGWILKRNYKDLTSTDIPMRERRGELRRWGYEILSDSLPGSYKRSLNLFQTNLAPQKGTTPSEPRTVDLNSMGIELLLGRADHLGLRLHKEGKTLSVYKRMCPHEGASLDSVHCKESGVKCPWHGRVLSPLATFELNENRTYRTENHEFKIQNNHLTITELPI